MDTTARLDAPLQLPSGLVLPNRVAKAAMSECLATSDGMPTEALVQLYERFSVGGSGLLITGNAIVDPGGRTEPNNVLLIEDRYAAEDLERLAAWARAAKAGGSAAFVQLSHAGRQTPRTVTWTPVAPSAVRLRGMGGLFSTPAALVQAQIEALVDRFARAAVMAEEAGFDGVQVHGAHGYLVSQFLSPLTNLRDDRYGGDLHGRMRFLIEVVRRIREFTRPGFSVAVKLNSADFQRGGFTLEDSMMVAQALAAEGIDLLEISGGTYEKPAMVGSARAPRASTIAREAFFLEYAQRMREVVDLPLMVTGGFRTRAAMIEALAAGATDLIGMARPLALAPEVAGQLVRGEIEAARSPRVGVGLRMVDDFLLMQWHQRQMHRMGNGVDPDAKLGAWSTLAYGLAHAYWAYARAGLRRDGHALPEAGEAKGASLPQRGAFAKGPVKTVGS
jgi:2,4-dienoyl-CoA reductase-like NADH-dependent reductase (Old Yellow Enzyme family)